MDSLCRMRKPSWTQPDGNWKGTAGCTMLTFQKAIKTQDCNTVFTFRRGSDQLISVMIDSYPAGKYYSSLVTLMSSQWAIQT